MGANVRLGRVLGFEVRLDYSWFLVFALLTYNLSVGVFPKVYRFDAQTSWILGATSALLLFASVLIHEVSHAVVARSYGIEVSGITLFLFGGVAQIKGEPEYPTHELLIAAIGPVVSAVLGAACLGLSFTLAPYHSVHELAVLLNYLGIINLGLAFFNLIPGFPLDGGRILRAALWRISGNLRFATRWAANAGHVVAFGMIVYGLVYRLILARDLSGLWLVFVGWFLHSAAESSYRQLVLRRALAGVPIADVMSHEIPIVDADLRVADFVDGFLLRYDAPVFPVFREGVFRGVVGADDVRALARNLWGVTCIGTIARVPDRDGVIQESQDAWEALSQMMESNAGRLLVMRNDQLEGVISRESILRVVQRKARTRLPA